MYISDKMGPCSEDGQIAVSPHGGLMRSQTLCSGQQVLLMHFLKEKCFFQTITIKLSLRKIDN